MASRLYHRILDRGTWDPGELSKRRSVAKRNGSFFADGVEHWGSEMEFGAERP